MAPALPCKTCKKSKHAETRSKTDEIKSKLVCVLEASESTRLCMAESLPNYHEDHIAAKGDNSLQHYNLFNKFIPMPQAMKIPAAKAAVDEEWEKLEKIPAWDLTKVRCKSAVIDGQGDGVPRHVDNRRRRTHEGPEPACVQTPYHREWHMQEEKGELTSCRGTV